MNKAGTARSYKVDFEPVGRRGECPSDRSLLDCARQLNVDIVSICGGGGSCDRCKVQVIAGKVSRPTLEEQAELSAEELGAGFRLACQTFPEGDVKIHVPPESLTAPQRTQVEGLEVDVEIDPQVGVCQLELVIPTLDEPLADDLNLLSTLRALGRQASHIDHRVQRDLSSVIREYDWRISAVVRGDEVIALGGQDAQWTGLAVDIGTTKIAAYLIDILTGKTLASRGAMNPQIAYGEDLISRIAAASKNAGEADRLQSMLVEQLNQLALELSEECGRGKENIAEAVVVGNTAIHHLFLNLPVKQLGMAPYIPAVTSAVDIKAREIGLAIAPGGYLHLLPNVAGYVGADHVAMLLATRIMDTEKITLAIDIGTNTEICLNYHGKLTSVSCASGPAFEGAHIKFGMRAAPGAIEHIRLDGDLLQIQTIGGKEPVGVCGSGLLDVVAQLRINGVLDRTGKMGEHSLVRKGKSTEFLLAERAGSEPITITQNDIRELQMAKGAIRAGIQALVHSMGLQEEQIEQVIIAGAFGTFIDIESAITIGMLPALPLERFSQVGNAAGTGARLALVSDVQRRKAIEIANIDGYIELARVPNFQRLFAEAMYL